MLVANPYSVVSQFVAIYERSLNYPSSPRLCHSVRVIYLHCGSVTLLKAISVILNKISIFRVSHRRGCHVHIRRRSRAPSWTLTRSTISLTTTTYYPDTKLLMSTSLPVTPQRPRVTPTVAAPRRNVASQLLKKSGLIRGSGEDVSMRDTTVPKSQHRSLRSRATAQSKALEAAKGKAAANAANKASTVSTHSTLYLSYS